MYFLYWVCALVLLYLGTDQSARRRQSREEQGHLPFCVVADAGIIKVSCHTTVVCPVVDEVDANVYQQGSVPWYHMDFLHELDPMSLSALHHVVQTLKAVGTSVDSRLPTSKRLKVHGAIARCGCDIIEAPDPKDLESGFFEMLHDEVDIVVVRKEPDPVGVGPCKVTGFPINYEASAARSWVRSRRGPSRGSRLSCGGGAQS